MLVSGARVLLITAPKWDALCDKRADATEIGLLKPFRCEIRNYHFMPRAHCQISKPHIGTIVLSTVSLFVFLYCFRTIQQLPLKIIAWRNVLKYHQSRWDNKIKVPTLAGYKVFVGNLQLMCRPKWSSEGRRAAVPALSECRPTPLFNTQSAYYLFGSYLFALNT